MAKTQTILIFEQRIALPETSIAYSQMFNFNSKIIHPPQTLVFQNPPNTLWVGIWTP